MLTAILSSLESVPLLNTATKEVVGINAPKIAFTRTADERVDAAVSEIGNTVAAFGIGKLIDLGLKKLFSGATGENAAKWATTSRTVGIYSAIFSMMWAMPFIRNYLTAKRTGKIQFASVIGNDTGKQTSDDDLTRAKKHYLKTAAKVLAIGVGVAVAAVTGGKMAIAKDIPFERLGKHAWKIVEKWGLKGGSFNDFNGLRAVLFWGVPAYAGWAHASRDQFEIKEQLLKFCTFVAGYWGMDELAKRFYKPRFEALLGEGAETTYKGITRQLAGSPKLAEAIRLWRNENIMGLASSILLLAGAQLANFALTGRRIKKAQAAQAAAAQAPALPTGTIQYKSFEDWGHRGYNAAPQSLTPSASPFIVASGASSL